MIRSRKAHLQSDLIIRLQLLSGQTAQRTVTKEAKMSLKVFPPLLPEF